MLATSIQNNMENNAKHTVVAFGEVLWDLLPTGPLIGGAPFNFANRINELGHTSLMVSRLGNDELGRKALDRIRELHLTTDFVQEDEHHPTGTVEVFLDENKNPDYTIIPHVAYDYVTCTEPLEHLMKEAVCLCFGSLAQRHTISRNTLHQLLNIFSGSYTFFDVNLRKNCYTEEIITFSAEKANILKLNYEEIVVVGQIYGWHENDLLPIAERLVQEAHLLYCLVTLSDKGVLAVAENGEKVYVPGFRVNMVDPLGAGDAFSAGFVHSLLLGKSLHEACCFGNALGALVVGQQGATQPLQAGKVDQFLKNLGFGAVDERFKHLMK